MKNIFLKFWPIGFILIVWFIFSWPFFSKGLVPFPSNYLVSRFPPWQYFYQTPIKNEAMPDVLSQLYPWRHLVVESFKNGQWPLWNPYLFSGTPLLANFQSAVFSPLNFLLLVFPFAVGWSLMILVQPLLAALFMFLFLRELKVSRWGSVVAATAFSFCGFMVVWMAYGTLSLAIAWLPLLLWAIEKSFKKASILPLTITSLSLAFSFFSGHFQTSVYAILAVVFYTIFKFWQTKNLRNFLFVTVFLFLGVLIASPQIFPSIELYFQSVRGQSFRQTEVIPWSYLMTLLAPDFFGNPTTGNNWFGHYAEWASFIGVWPLILGVWVFLKKRGNKEVAFFFLLGIVSLLFSLDTPLTDLLTKLKIPVLSTSANSRLIVIFSFTFSVLAGFAIDSLRKEWEERKNFKNFFLYLLAAGVALILLWLSVLFFHFWPADKIMIIKRNLFLPSLIYMSGAIILSSGFILRKNLKAILLVVILIIIAFDSLRFAVKWMPFEKPEHLYPQLPVTKFLQKEVGINRVFGNFGNELAVYFHIPSIEGYDPLYPKRYKELISAVNDSQIGDLFADRSTVLLEKNAQHSPRLLSLLGIKYLLHAKDDGWSPWVFPFWKNLDQYDLVYDGPKYQVLENKKSLPRVFLVGDYEVSNDPKAIIKQLLDEDFDYKNKLILEEKLSEEISPGSGEVKITDYTSGKIKIEVIHSQPQLLFLSDNYYPGWQAKVDGWETKIYRANYAFRAIFVPEGKHLVEFIYDPISFKAGLILSGGAILALAALNLIAILKRRNQ